MDYIDEVVMTSTAQHRSVVFFNNSHKNIIKTEISDTKSAYSNSKDFQSTDFKPADTKRLLLSLFDSLNNLNEKLSRLEYLVHRKKIEQILYKKFKGENI